MQPGPPALGGKTARLPGKSLKPLSIDRNFGCFHVFAIIISPNKTYRWSTNTWKDVQHRRLLEKCKLKPQCGITSHRSEWPSSKGLQIINAREGMEKRTASYTVCGNVNWYSTMESSREAP